MFCLSKVRDYSFSSIKRDKKTKKDDNFFFGFRVKKNSKNSKNFKKANTSLDFVVSLSSRESRTRAHTRTRAHALHPSRDDFDQ